MLKLVPVQFYVIHVLDEKKTWLHIAQVVFDEFRQFPMRWIFHPDQLLFFLSTKNAGPDSYLSPALIVFVKIDAFNKFSPDVIAHYQSLTFT